MTNRKQWLKAGRLTCLGASILLFAISLMVPAYLFGWTEKNPYGRPSSWTYGYAALGLGWLGLLIGQFGWLANLPVIVGWVALALKKRMLALFSGASAFLLSLDTIRLFYMEWRSEAHQPPRTLEQLGPGFYLWTMSMLVVVMGAVMCGGSDLNQGENASTRGRNR